MTVIIVQWLLSAISLMIVAHIVPGFEVRSFGSALLAAVVIGLVNATIGLVLKVLTFPLTILTFGLFLLVVNAFVLWLVAALVPGIRVKGFGPALVGSLVLTLLNMAVAAVFGPGWPAA